MTNKMFELASLALVAGFMTSSFDSVGMNEEGTKIDKEVQCNRVAFVQVAGFNLIVDRNPNQSQEDIYNYIYPSIEQAALGNRSVVDYIVYVFPQILQSTSEEVANIEQQFYSQETIKILASYCAEKLAGCLYSKVVSGNL